VATGIAQTVQRFVTGWTVRGSNVSGREIFHTRPDRPQGSPSFLHIGYRAILEGKVAVARLDHTTTCISEVEETAELYLYLPSVPLWQIIG